MYLKVNILVFLTVVSLYSLFLRKQQLTSTFDFL